MVEARGSANGSAKCFLLGITQVDSVKWKIRFERFLSLDRIKGPDIDLDIQASAHDRVIEYVKAKYPARFQRRRADSNYRPEQNQGTSLSHTRLLCRVQRLEYPGRYPVLLFYRATRIAQI